MLPDFWPRIRAYVSNGVVFNSACKQWHHII
jgi:hypothetical protein